MFHESFHKSNLNLDFQPQHKTIPADTIPHVAPNEHEVSVWENEGGATYEREQN